VRIERFRDLLNGSTEMLSEFVQGRERGLIKWVERERDREMDKNHFNHFKFEVGHTKSI